MEKYIFLDFDGVITTLKSGWALDKEKVELLGEILNATDAKLVISSTWRRDTVENTIKYLKTISNYVPFEFPYCDKIVGITIDLYDYYKTPCCLPRYRGVEIDHWLENYAYVRKISGGYYDKVLGEDYQYVILDDDTDMLYWQKDNFVKTNALKGLSRANVNKAIKILNTPKKV